MQLAWLLRAGELTEVWALNKALRTIGKQACANRGPFQVVLARAEFWSPNAAGP